VPGKQKRARGLFLFDSGKPDDAGGRRMSSTMKKYGELATRINWACVQRKAPRSKSEAEENGPVGGEGESVAGT